MLDIISVHNIQEWPPAPSHIEFALSKEAEEMLKQGRAKEVGQVVGSVLRVALGNTMLATDKAVDLVRNHEELAKLPTGHGVVREFYDSVVESVYADKGVSA
jgi:hypothetical protein